MLGIGYYRTNILEEWLLRSYAKVNGYLQNDAHQAWKLEKESAHIIYYRLVSTVQPRLRDNDNGYESLAAPSYA